MERDAEIGLTTITSGDAKRRRRSNGAKLFVIHLLLLSGVSYGRGAS